MKNRSSRQYIIILGVILMLGLLSSCCCGTNCSDTSLTAEERSQCLIDSTENAKSWYSTVGKLLDGEHEITALVTNKSDVLFTWINEVSGQTINSSVQRDKIRVIYHDTNISPTIKFRWLPNGTKDYAKIMNEFVVYIELYCKKSQYPENVTQDISWTLSDIIKEDATVIKSNPTNDDIEFPWDNWSVDARYEFLMYTLYYNGEKSTMYSKMNYMDLDRDVQDKITANWVWI